MYLSDNRGGCCRAHLPQGNPRADRNAGLDRTYCDVLLICPIDVRNQGMRRAYQQVHTEFKFIHARCPMRKTFQVQLFTPETVQGFVRSPDPKWIRTAHVRVDATP